MDQMASCPQRGEYEQFILGTSSAQDGERLLNHLQNCRTCNESIEHLLQADIVVEALRTHQIEFQPGQATVTVERLVKHRAWQAAGGSIPAPHEQTLAMPAEAVRQAEVGQRTVGIEAVG